MGDHELEIGGKFGVPEFHGFAASIDARYKARWGKHTRGVLAAAADAADLDPAQLGAALEANDGATDLLYTAMNRAVEVSDRDYISALGRLVGQALDPALIEETAFLTAELIRLEPIHLRILLMGFRYVRDGAYVDDPNDGVAAAALRPQDGEDLDAEVVAERLDISQLTAKRAIDRLVAEDLFSQIGIAGHTLPSLAPTDWSGRAVLLMFPNLTEVWLGEDRYARR